MNITLNNNSGFFWHNNKTVFVKGYFFVDDFFYDKQKALDYLSEIKNKDDFLNIVNRLNGVFTIIIYFNDVIHIACDTTRAFPVFYTKKNNDWFISDDILQLKKRLNNSNFNPISELELKASLHTYGCKTLLNDVFQIQSNECLSLHPNNSKVSSFSFSYAIKNEFNASHKKLKQLGNTAFNTSFKRLIDSLQEKTVVVPLSGGFDSRLIAVMLKHYNYKNVICYTYGQKNSFEIENSKKTAKALDFDWYFIEYNDALLDNFLESNEFKKYAHFAGKLSSMPNLQEYFAVKYLKENNLIPTDSIFIPGYAGDLLGGSQFLKVIPENFNHNQLTELIISKKFTYFPISTSEKRFITKEIERILMNFDKNYLDKRAYSVFEDFDIKEKIGKFIFNSASFYTYFGYEFRFPFWDKELLNFFKKVPKKHKKMKVLFDEILIDNYFKKYNVNFESELQPSEKKVLKQNVKNKVKTILPTFIKQKFLKKNDWINYKTITEQMLTSLRKKGVKPRLTGNSYNEIITQWYLYFSKNEIN